tara:strand:+ start:407 stop:589 length:183 start_codon:yes stop_codon:yes gene_type:complete
MKKEKLYSPEETGTFKMMFGMKNLNTSGKKRYEKKKKYLYIDKRTKKFGNQRVELLKINK